MKLSNTQRRYLRGLAHPLKPVVTIGGKGLSDAVMAEIETALEHHELLKLKLPAVERAERQQMLDEICAVGKAVCVQSIGRVGVIYRPAKNPKIPLPKS